MSELLVLSSGPLPSLSPGLRSHFSGSRFSVSYRRRGSYFIIKLFRLNDIKLQQIIFWLLESC